MIATLEDGRQTARSCRRRSGKSGFGEHCLDGLDTGNRFFGKGKTESDGAEQFAPDIDWATAHALHNAGMLEGSAGEAGEDEGFFGTDVIEDAEYFDLEILDFGGIEDGTPGSAHTWFDVLERQERSLARKGGGQRKGRRNYVAKHNPIVLRGTGEICHENLTGGSACATMVLRGGAVW